jgi:hypothetical protein
MTRRVAKRTTHEFIRQLSIEIQIDSIYPRIRHSYDDDDQGEYDDSVDDEEEEEEDDEQAARTKRKNLNNLSSSLQSAIHLIVSNTKSVSIEIDLDLEDYNWMFIEDPQYDYAEGDGHTLLSIYDFEHGLINILEAIRKPV